MKKDCHLLLMILVPALMFGMLAAAAAPQDSENKAQSKPAKETCLACHGPFDKLAADTADYETPSGEKTSPHKYIPHADKMDIPECTECHTPHPVPIQDKAAVVKAGIDYCYTSCHHAHNLQPCSACH